MPDETPFVVPDKIAPELGWRVWLVLAYDNGCRLALHSVVYAGTEWPVGTRLQASCEKSVLYRGFLAALGDVSGGEPHDAPSSDCAASAGCGIYATADVNTALPYLSYATTHQFVRALKGGIVHRVIGRCHLWGRTIAGERGWRAEFAYPQQLWVPRTLPAPAGPHVGEPVVLPRLPYEQIADMLGDYRVPVGTIKDVRELAA